MSDPMLAPGCRECPKCGETFFGSLALHICPEPMEEDEPEEPEED